VRPTGNPSPDLIGDDRKSDNLSGFGRGAGCENRQAEVNFNSPHDVWDYDAQETPALLTSPGRIGRASFWCRPTAMALHVLDRTDGKFLRESDTRRT
jgi:glucose dehydrogenase